MKSKWTVTAPLAGGGEQRFNVDVGVEIGKEAVLNRICRVCSRLRGVEPRNVKLEGPFETTAVERQLIESAKTGAHRVAAATPAVPKAQ